MYYLETEEEENDTAVFILFQIDQVGDRALNRLNILVFGDKPVNPSNASTRFQLNHLYLKSHPHLKIS